VTPPGSVAIVVAADFGRIHDRHGPDAERSDADRRGETGGHLLWRVELRHDRSDVASFRADRGAFVKTQHTIGFGLLYSFSTKP
jgi:hypothetical protein